MNAFELALKHLWREKFSTLLVVLAIGISAGFSGILLRMHLLSISRFERLETMGDAVVGAKASEIEILLGALNLETPKPLLIPENLYWSIKQRKGVAFEDGAVSVPVYVKEAVPLTLLGKSQNAKMIATDESFIQIPFTAHSPQIGSGTWPANGNECVAGSELALEKNLKVGDTISVDPLYQKENAAVPPFPFRVSGILKPMDSAWDAAYFTNREAQYRVFDATLSPKDSQWGSKAIHYFVVFLEPNGFSPLERLINGRTVAEAVSIESTIERLREWTGKGRSLGLFFSFLLIFLAGLTVVAMMTTRFDAMSVSLSVLRAMGKSKSTVFSWLFFEGMLLGLGGILLGACLDTLLFPWIRSLLGTAVPQEARFYVPIFQSAPVWLGACIAICLSTLVPLVRIYRQDVHQHLKGL